MLTACNLSITLNPSAPLACPTEQSQASTSAQLRGVVNVQYLEPAQEFAGYLKPQLPRCCPSRKTVDAPHVLAFLAYSKAATAAMCTLLNGVEVRDVEGRGRGLLAVRDIRAGETVLTALPIFIVCHHAERYCSTCLRELSLPGLCLSLHILVAGCLRG